MLEAQFVYAVARAWIRNSSAVLLRGFQFRDLAMLFEKLVD
jgi:hypothetical protein